ncbi:MAG: hypothetical protein MJ159_01560 [Treponemataceae bacterium]|nr:hypothetical protein [Treponemataceae bacterium]
MEYKVKVNITEKDFLASIAEIYLHKKIAKIMVICLFCMPIFGLFSGILLKSQISEILNDTIPYIILIVSYILLFPFIYRRIYNNDKTLYDEQELLIRGDNILQSLKHGYFDYSLKDFRYIIFGKRTIVIFISLQKFIILPRHCFSSKEEEQAVEAFIKAHYVTDKKQK